MQAAHTESIRETFKPHQEEIQRRVKSTSEDHSRRSFEVVDCGLDLPYVIPDQRYILLSLSHVEFGPKATDARHPAVCIYGVFETSEDAAEHASHIQSIHPEFSLMIHPTHEWFVGISHLAHMTNDYAHAHISTMLERETKKREADTSEFEKNVESHEIAEVAEKDETPEKEPTPALDGKGKKFKIRSGCGVSNQAVIAVSFLRGTGDVPEFIMRVYAAFENEETANAYVRNVAGEKVHEYDIDVISTCSWIYPQSLLSASAPKEVFRSDELTRVMAAHKSNPKQVERFYRENPDVRTQQKVESSAPILEISHELREPEKEVLVDDTNSSE